MHKPLVMLFIGAAIMFAVIAYGLIVGDLFQEAGPLLGYPWFHVSMVDLYVGFLLFGGWILFRESSLLKAIGWIVLVCLLGNLVTCIYAAIAMMRAQGDWQQFWLGDRAGA